jgi:ketosteroid isomerase-like protein
MHPNESRIREFYAAFAARDAEAMARCYHPEVFFSDPVFPRLRGPDAADMWRMLLSRAADLQVTLDDATADDAGGLANWTARYTFSRTGRPVVNHVRGMFAFRDGLIVRHYDHFSFWRWASQALGPVGRALGWFAGLKWKVRRDAARSLERFMDRDPASRGTAPPGRA